MKKILFVISIFILFNFIVLSAERNLEGINLITREEWGADESWLLSWHEWYDSIIATEESYKDDMIWLKKNNIIKYNSLLENQKKEKDRIDYLYKEFPEELSIDYIKYKLNGVTLWWERFFHHNKTKIVIHHTASSQSKYSTQDEFIKHLIWIYKFHTFTRWWGDIGYNFIIDPWGNIYEWRAWWEGVVWAHLKYNNISSIGIALAWNFDIDNPTQAQIDSMVNLWAALSVKYNINPYDLIDYHRKWGSEYPYIEDIKHLSIVWHRDAGYTSCPWEKLYSKLPDIRRDIFNKSKILISKQKWIITPKENTKKEITRKKPKLSLLDRIRIELDKRMENYISSHKVSNASNLSQKISSHIRKEDISSLERKPVKVLLYELSSNFTKWETSFIGSLELVNGDTVIKKDISQETNIDITYNKWKFYYIGHSYEKIIIHSSNIIVKNYNRKSYAGLPLNIFEWKLIFMKDKVKIWGSYINTSAIINELSFFHYLRWIGEVWDNQPYQKIKAISLLVKWYLIFYIQKENTHPSIPEDSYYNAIDDPRFFQKFVGKWFIPVWTKWQKAIKETSGRYVLYKWELAFTPYFSCSAWFTFDAKKKWWWTDTPYLKASFDFTKCDDFLWHGVGLSGKWAEWLANKWIKYGSIIRWYFPGTSVVNVRAK